MAFYIQIVAVQSPFPIGLDENNRTVFACNYYLTSHGTTNVEEDVAQIIIDAGHGTRGVGGNIYIGPDAKIPGGDGPFISIILYGGNPPMETHNGDLYPEPAVQITTRATNYRVARQKALDVWNSLHGQRNVTVTV